MKAQGHITQGTHHTSTHHTRDTQSSLLFTSQLTKLIYVPPPTHTHALYTYVRTSQNHKYILSAVVAVYTCTPHCHVHYGDPFPAGEVAAVWMDMHALLVHSPCSFLLCTHEQVVEEQKTSHLPRTLCTCTDTGKCTLKHKPTSRN